MHIQEIVVDGFKSYAHRTVISGFDPHFNAITGLNGSGKSNILDSICFVLGITNLSQVRAGNLSELVYKQGQAGITKASVTVVFDNSDPHGSPVGYEECSEITVTRQVLLGGKSKYLVNGRVTPVGQVTNLFHSVQLNVNNPHFLIMQGRITKVLNMKADEILGMVEEAAGTRMYETKRVAALKTIEKKQTKLDELNTILTEEITPTLARLRNEKQAYLKWSKNNADVERLQRFVVAAEYHAAKTAVEKGQSSVEELSEQAEALSRQAQAYQADIDTKVKQMDSLSSKMDLQGELGAAHKQAKSEEDKRLKELVKLTTGWQNCKAVVARAEEDLQASQTLVTETRHAMDVKTTQIQADQHKSQSVKDDLVQAEQLLSRLMTEFQNMCAGISNGQGEDTRTLPDQISKAHNDANTADAKVKQATMKMTHLKKNLVAVEKDLKKEEKSAEKLAASKTKAVEKLAAIEKKLSDIDFSQAEYDALESEKGELQTSIKSLKDTISTLSAQIQGRLAFDYTDPVRGFDRSKVKGVVAKLVNVPRKENSTALEVVAGGKLFQVVVDEAMTGQALLSRGKLQRRVTIIPLDKIQSKRITSSAVSEAEKIAQQMSSTVYPAIELLTFSEEVRGAIEYVFGSSLVVDKPDAANKICDVTHTRTVTLEGDAYDPSGTISGGSKDNFGNTLAHLSALATAKVNLEEKEKQLQKISSRLDGMRSNFKSFEKLGMDLEVAKAELESVNKHISHTSYGMLLEKFNAMSAEIEEASAEAEAMSLEKEAKWNLYNHLKEKESELTKQRESRLSGIENQVTQAKSSVAVASQKARDAESVTQTLAMELDVLKAELSAANEAVAAAEKALKKAQDSESDMEIKVAELKILCDNAKSAVESIDSKMSSCSTDLKKLSKEKANLLKLMETSELESKKLSLEVAQMKKDSTSNSRLVSSMLKKYPWIETEEHAFGVPGSDYDFEHSQLGEMKDQLKTLQNEQNTLAKGINKKVMGMIEKAEGEYTELLRKRKVVDNDRKKIQAVIEELDVKKKSELQRTWVKVNADFGSIFSTLLPGASAKLEPPEGMEAWEGLEVKVAFGNVWKESLSELSGGQRSLLALSLILSLLLFKPAPMYILDEVDAALDLSHTQNIGSMLRTHFAHSQFIVVSLKEGMFNNANVIFRTKFVDGVSTVTRTIGAGATMKSRPLLLNDENGSNTNSGSTSPARKRVARNAVNEGSVVGKEN